MEPIDRLNQAIHYIEENLHDSVDYHEISKITLSPISAFQRFFCLTTGISLFRMYNSDMRLRYIHTPVKSSS